MSELEIKDIQPEILVPKPVTVTSIELAPVAVSEETGDGRTIPVFTGTIPNPYRHAWSLPGHGDFPAWTHRRAQRGPITQGYCNPAPNPRLDDYSPTEWLIGGVRLASRSEIERTKREARFRWYRPSHDKVNGPGWGKELDFWGNRYYDLAAILVSERRAQSEGAPPRRDLKIEPDERPLYEALRREDSVYVARLAEQPRIGLQSDDVPIGSMIWLLEFKTLDEAYLYQESFRWGSGRYPSTLVEPKPEWIETARRLTEQAAAYRTTNSVKAETVISSPMGAVTQGAPPTGA